MVMFQESVTNLMRAFRDLNMHVLFLCKEDVVNDDGILRHAPAMVGTKLGASKLQYSLTKVLALSNY